MVVLFFVCRASTKVGRAKLSQVQFGEADVLCISYDQLKIYAEDLRKIPQIGIVMTCIACGFLICLFRSAYM